MEKLYLLLILITLSLSHPTSTSSRSRPTTKPDSQITVMGTVYCDICSNNTFSAHSYFLSGVEVKIDCKFKALAPKTAEEITFSVNRTTNRFGMYRLEVPSVEGIQCGNEHQDSVVSLCKATLVGPTTTTTTTTTTSSDNDTNNVKYKCDVPGYKSTSDVVYFKSRETNVCIYGLSALSLRPTHKSKALCGN